MHSIDNLAFMIGHLFFPCSLSVFLGVSSPHFFWSSFLQIFQIISLSVSVCRSLDSSNIVSLFWLSVGSFLTWRDWLFSADYRDTALLIIAHGKGVLSVFLEPLPLGVKSKLVSFYCESLSRGWLFATLWMVSHEASAVHRILQARVLEYIAFSGRSSQPRDQTGVSCTAGRFLTV